VIASGAWRWFAWSVAAIGIGLTLWWTAFVLVPAGAVMIIIGIVRWITGSKA
jgi:hypothetical protein